MGRIHVHAGALLRVINRVPGVDHSLIYLCSVENAFQEAGHHRGPPRLCPYGCCAHPHVVDGTGHRDVHTPPPGGNFG